ncbi:arylamine N-acetyltransferase [Streptomyces sp. NPDC047860]|uniref:arylamine N-acetyltransferase n=1 Tax=Streptomyces sp. NPDC047860 TaxID=3155743 RepID=UPI0033CE04BD
MTLRSPTGDGGRITLSGRRLTVTAPDGTREERETGTDEEVLALYRDRFGIASLDTVPKVWDGVPDNGPCE